MRIAVTYEDGNIFEHFGRTEQFKVYEVLDDKITSSEVMSSNGIGHEALAYLLAEKDIDVLICGGMGAGAQAALSDAGLIVCAGQSGDADVAVNAYLRGELTDKGVTCDHHDHEEEGHGCGGSCAGCSGCHPAEILYDGPNAGKTVRVHYRGTFNDGEQFDSSYDRGEPLEFVCGAGMMIEGFDKAVLDMQVGDKKSIHLMPSEAYGEADPEAIFTVRIEELPGAETLSVGSKAYLTNSYGQPFMVKVTAKTETDITFDANSEMAGKELNFDIELVSTQSEKSPAST